MTPRSTKSAKKKAPSVRQLRSELAEANRRLSVQFDDLLASGAHAEELARRLEQTEDVLADSEERLVAAREREQFDGELIYQLRHDARNYRDTNHTLVDELDITRDRLKAQTDNAINAAGAAAVLAYLVIPRGSLDAIMADFRTTAMQMGIGPKVKKAATAALTQASAAFVSGEWPTDKATQAQGGLDLLSVLESMVGGGGASLTEDELAALFGPAVGTPLGAFGGNPLER